MPDLPDMNTTTLARHLNSIGNQMFIDCFWSLRAVARGTLAPAACAIMILGRKEYGTEIGEVLVRISLARTIFAAGRERDAVALIASRLSAHAEWWKKTQAILDRLDRVS